MKTKLLLLAVFVMVLGISSKAQVVYAAYHGNADEFEPRVEVFYSSVGYYHWELVENRVWVPGRAIITSHGVEIIPGHWDIYTERVKCYDVRHFPPPPRPYYHKCHKKHKHHHRDHDDD